MAEDNMLAEIERRAVHSRERYSKRDTRFEQLYRAYDGDIWDTPEPRDPREQRVTNRLVADTVDMDAAILVSKMPIVTVPAGPAGGLDKVDASNRESAIMGAWNMMDFSTTLFEAARYAALTGWFVIRGPIDTQQGDFPLVAYAIDPRCIYPGLTATKKLQWCFFQQYRTAGDIRMEVPKTLKGPWHVGILPKEDDKLCLWTDYWGWHGKDLMHAIFVDEAEQQNGYGTIPSGLEKAGGQTISPTSVSPDSFGEALKDPTKMNRFYPDIPYFLAFPRPDPRPERGFEGFGIAERLIEPQKRLSQAMTVLASDAFCRGNPSWVVDGMILEPHDDKGQAFINTDPGATNVVSAGTKVQPLMGIVDNDLVQTLFEIVGREAQRSGFPSSMHGQYEAAESGLAISTRNNPVQMKEASAQKAIEACLEKFNSFLLKMMSKMPKSARVYGRDKQGSAFEMGRGDMVFGDNTFNIVQLSASLPKDIPLMISTLTNVLAAKGISKRTLMEYVQNLLDLPNKSPEWEFEQMQQEDVEQAKANIDTQAAIMAYQTMQAAEQAGAIPPGMPPQLGMGGDAGMQIGQPGVPAGTVAPQAIGGDPRAIMANAGQPMMPQIPGAVSGAQGAPNG